MTGIINRIKKGLKALLICVVIPIMLSACWEDLEEISVKIGGGGGDSFVISGTGGIAGNNQSFTKGTLVFNMKYVPGGTFPTGTTDLGGNQTINTAYWMAETEVTYELWYTVRTWAIANGYTLDANPGREGNDGTITAGPGSVPTAAKQEPVTTINWREAMVWCNALTEYYNANNGADPDLDLVYYTDSGYTTPIRAATDSTTITWDSGSTYSGTEDEPYVKTTAKGFRLPGGMEWECAARYRGINTTNVVTGTVIGVDFSAMIYKWTKGNSASGAATYYNDVTGDPNFAGKLTNDSVAVYYSYWNGSGWASTGVSSTAAVKSKTTGYNALGLYDMSGNVWSCVLTGTLEVKGLTAWRGAGAGFAMRVNRKWVSWASATRISRSTTSVSALRGLSNFLNVVNRFIPACHSLQWRAGVSRGCCFQYALSLNSIAIR